MSIETPKYKVINKDGVFDLREYSGYITANVKIRADSYNQAVNSGFSYLADYIFGNNHASDKISMTVPVNAERLRSQKIAMTAPVNTRLDGASYLVNFTMPSKYKISELPIPNDNNVFIMEIKPYCAIAIKFSGYLNDESFSVNEKKLRDWAEKNKHEIVGQAVSSQFDPPWKPWFLRHNEVYLEVRKPNG